MQMNYSDFYWLNDDSRLFLQRGYIGEQLAENRVLEIGMYAEKILGKKGLAQDIYHHAKRGFYSFSSPVWVNFGKNKGLSISCYGSVCEDSLDSILNMGREIGMMSKYGGGTSAFVGNIRPRGTEISTGGYADGPVHYSHIYDTIIDKCKQAEARRGACALWLQVEHPDVMEFLNIGTEGNDIQNLQFGVTIGDEWMNAMVNGDAEKRKIWAKILERRIEFGFPYIMFSDNTNNNSPYNELGMRVLHSNLCSEIQLPNNVDESFVCCLGSLNLLHWDEMKNTNAVEVYIDLLNAVMRDFINSTEDLPGMVRAHRFAKNHRAIGLGVLGYHSYLQSKGVPVESLRAKNINHEIFKTISERANNRSQELCSELGITSIREGYANTTTMAIAPTKSSSFILGQVSMGIEPYMSNYFVKDLAKVKSVFKNPFLEKHLEELGLNTTETWEDILAHNGSVQHMDIPNKEVFKTFAEISPSEIVLQAAQRQQFIDQSQSLNLYIHPSVPVKDINKVHIDAWKQGVKTLYYQIGESSAQNFVRDITTCVSCEG
jgi:ribonucleoside-diphosphate reductase alpha chain